MLVLLYTADILAIARRHGVGAHPYTDDSQLYRHASADLCVASVSVVVSCIGELNRWMCINRLKLNTDKTAFILLETRQQIEKGNFHYLYRWHRRSFINYRDMPGSPHRQRANIRSPNQALDRKVLLPASSALSVALYQAARTLVHAFVISCVDYCNSIFGSTSAVHLRSLHCVLNAAARLIIKRRKFDRITDSLCDERHWLPFQYRHTYKNMPSRVQVFSWNCPLVPHQAMHTGCGQPCSEQSTVGFQP